MSNLYLEISSKSVTIKVYYLFTEMLISELLITVKTQKQPISQITHVEGLGL